MTPTDPTALLSRLGYIVREGEPLPEYEYARELIALWPHLGDSPRLREMASTPIFRRRHEAKEEDRNACSN